jgi:hypothetical protein
MSNRMTGWVPILTVFLLPVAAPAQEVDWQAVLAPETPPVAATLGRPEPLNAPTNGPTPASFLGGNLAPVAYNEPAGPGGVAPPPEPSPSVSVPPPPPPAVPAPATSAPHTGPVEPPDPLVSSASAAHVTNQGPPDAVPPPTGGPVVPPPPGADVPVNNGVVLDRPLQHSWWDRCMEFFSSGGDRCSASGRCLFQSDHAFDRIASPVTNPFLFEDPRALTELKPLFIYQGAPNTNAIFRGGNAEFYGMQARVAFTERFSVTLNELGFVSLNPNNPAADPTGQFSKSTGFAQVEVGPKYTFWRCPERQSVAAGGVIFQIPGGSARVFQNIGTLGIVPYLAGAKSFCLPGGWGSINLIDALGYSFSVDNKRSEYFYNSFHIDYNIANTGIYPFLEVNYFHYTVGGKANNFGFEGLDLVNFGSSNVGKRDYLGMGPGLRFKINEHIQFGGAVTWPVLNQKEINDYTVVFDIIFRY